MLQQAIEHPFGISVFGSSLLRVEPDIVSLEFKIENTAEHPKAAFAAVRTAAAQVRQYLGNAGVAEFGSSQIDLSSEFRRDKGEKQFLGYKANVYFQAILLDLERTEEVLLGALEAGATEISRTNFQTSLLKELRAKARQEAVAAAREKAQLYAAETGVALGRVLHIEDVNPETIRTGFHMGGGGEVSLDAEVEPRAFNPASIQVAAAVVMAFAFAEV